MYSFLLIGQSNAAGRGKPDEVSPLDTDRLYVQRLGRWRTLYTPVNPDLTTAGVCLAESFAFRCARHYNADIGIIPCAFGGSAIAEWLPGEPLYENAVFQARLAQRSSQLVGVLWHQGESDCMPGRYETWSEKCTLVFEQLRKDLALDPQIPFLMGGLGDYLANYEGTLCDGNVSKCYRAINEQMRSMAERFDYIRFVSAQGLSPNPDNLHFNAPSLRRLGERYFDTFIQASPLAPAKESERFVCADTSFDTAATLK